MQSENKFFDDLAKMVNGMAGTVAGVGREAKENFRERNREWMAGLDLVSREEFDAVKAMASKARTEADALAKRVAKLEAAAGGKAKPSTLKGAVKRASAAKSAPRKTAAKKASPKKVAPKKAAAKKPAARKKPTAKK